MSNEMQIPTEPIERARYAAETMLAFAKIAEEKGVSEARAKIQLSYRGNYSWTPINNPPVWNWDEFDYYIKPDPTYRPWRLDEVPVGAVVRRKKTPTTREMILAASFDDDDGLPVKLSVYGWVNMEYLFQNYEQLGSAPCGIKEGAE